MTNDQILVQLTAIETKVDALQRDVSDLKTKVLLGNGKESLMTRVHNLESENARRSGFSRFIVPTGISLCALLVSIVAIWG
jgi:hypothetical protein